MQKNSRNNERGKLFKKRIRRRRIQLIKIRFARMFQHGPVFRASVLIQRLQEQVFP